MPSQSFKSNLLDFYAGDSVVVLNFADKDDILVKHDPA